MQRRSLMVRNLVRYGRADITELAEKNDGEIEAMAERLKLEVVVPDRRKSVPPPEAAE